MRLRFPVACLLAVVSLSVALHGQQPQLCTEWHECRQMALDAAARGEYELFHDLAWRTVQTGPRNDPALMFLLARAQALSGRPHDALVMLQRLADKGVATSAVTDPDFRHARELPGWPEVETALAAGVSVAPPPPIKTVAAAVAPSPEPAVAPSPKPAVAPAPKPAVAPPPKPAVALSPEPAPGAASEAAQFSTQRFRPAGLAFDAVSKRFVIGDALGRKLIVVGVGSEHTDDMVRADSAGFGDVVALGIDAQRGDLWVASAAEASGTSSLHRLQLVSGRPIKTYGVPASLGATSLVDLAVQPSGGVITLDAAGNRLLMLARGAEEVVAGVRLDLTGATSITSAGENIVYIAHDDGIARVDVKARTVVALSGPKGLDLTGFDSIRTHRDSIVGLQTASGRQRQLVRLKLNAAGRGVREASVIDRQIVEADGRVILNITGDELYYMAAVAAPAGATEADGRTEAVPFVIRHVALR